MLGHLWTPGMSRFFRRRRLDTYGHLCLDTYGHLRTVWGPRAGIIFFVLPFPCSYHLLRLHRAECEQANLVKVGGGSNHEAAAMAASPSCLLPSREHPN